MKLSLIVAVGNNHVIGRGNSLPWHLPEDLQYFKSVTLGKPVIMGRKTFESIGRVLPGRPNIVVTRQPDPVLPAGATPAASLEGALQVARQLEPVPSEVMVIGGAEIYRQALELADQVYLTRIEVDVSDGDAFFPELPKDQWQLVADKPGPVEASLPHCYQIYQRLVKK